MAGRGPAPKPTTQRRRRNTDPVPSTEVVPDEQLRGPALPDGFEWHAQTLKWWATWRRSAQAQTFIDTDWDFLLETAVLHTEYWLGDRSNAAELRLRVAKYGATPEDRARLRMEITPPDPDEQPKAKGRTPARKTPQRSARDPRARLKVVENGAAS